MSLERIFITLLLDADDEDLVNNEPRVVLHLHPNVAPVQVAEIGTPFCVTIDFQTLNDQAVTIRQRDTTKQERVEKARADRPGALTP